MGLIGMSSSQDNSYLPFLVSDCYQSPYLSYLYFWYLCCHRAAQVDTKYVGSPSPLVFCYSHCYWIPSSIGPNSFMVVAIFGHNLTPPLWGNTCTGEEIDSRAVGFLQRGGSSSLTSSSRMHQTNSETQKNHMQPRYTTSVTKMVQTARKPVANFLFRLKWINGGISIRSGESRFAAAAASLTPFELLWSALSFETDSVCNSKERRVRKLRIYSFNGL